MICNHCKYYSSEYWSKGKIVCSISKAIRDEESLEYYIKPTCIHDSNLELKDLFEPLSKESNEKWIKQIEFLKNDISNLKIEIQKKDKAIGKLMS